MTTVRARPDRNTSRLRVFREEEFGDDDAFAEQPTADMNPQPRIRPAKITEPLPLPRPPNRR